MKRLAEDFGWQGFTMFGLMAIVAVAACFYALAHYLGV
jgi:hypothetical protein